MKVALSIFIVIHAGIHLLGYFKAFGIIDADQFTTSISKPMGAIWLMVALSFIITAAFYILDNESWSIWLLISATVSQLLIFTVWNDAKFGTILNIVFIGIAIFSWAETSYENSYRQDVAHSISQSPVLGKLVTETDLAHLPKPVKNYLNYVGVVGKPRVENFRISFDGEMRDKGKDWFKFQSEQYNFIDDPTRLFFMRAKVSGIPAAGYHRYLGNDASMVIKIGSLIPVVKVDDAILFPTETVTFFNDLCLFAPSALIDKKIEWETIDEHSARAFYSNQGVTISATLTFNEEGQLVNFESNDRYAISEMKAVPFSTPMADYQEINEYRLPTYGEAIWHYPDGKFIYGKFRLKTIEYNLP